MKNRYLTRCLCITLVSGMIFTTAPTAVLAAETAELSSEGDFSDHPEDDFISVPGDPELTPEEPTPTPLPPTPTPGEPDVTPTPGEPSITPTPGEPSVTPTPGEPSITPTPGEPSVTPTPEVQDKIRLLMEKINKLALETITLDHKETIEKIRKEYDLLTEEEKLLVTNYPLFQEIEKKLAELEKLDETEHELPFDDSPDPFISDSTNVNPPLIGQPVYYTNMVSNLHAGKEFYLNSLKKNYQLSFSDDFADVMEAIEKEYKEKNKLQDACDRNGGMTSSEDTLLVRNWQDIIAIYIYEQNQKGVKEYKLDASCKDELAKIFAMMNPVVRDKKNITKVTYGNRHINYYIKKNKIARKDRKVLKKYVETDCKLLSATVTAAKGFVRQSVGDDVSEERVNVLTAAYSLVGKVGYFWGGKYNSLGENPSWGSVYKVSAPGSNSTGTLRAYGLDCSGFVTWAVINGYQNTTMQALIGDGTSDQWYKANVISEAEAQPGDLVFQRGPEAGSDNHVGILCGKTDAGDWIAVHCSSGQNGVTVGEAYSASFRYIRQASFYPDSNHTQQAPEAGAVNTEAAGFSDVQVSDPLQALLNNQNAQSDFIGPVIPGDYMKPDKDFVGPTLSLLDNKIVLSQDEIQIFKAE